MLDADDCDQLIESANPIIGRRPDAELEAALARVCRILPELERPAKQHPGARRARGMIATGLAVVVVAVAFGLANLLPASGGPAGVSGAWAKQLIAHVGAVLARPGDGILHIDERIVITPADGSRPAQRAPVPLQFESWQEQTPPYAYWQNGRNRADRFTTVITSRIVRYDSSGNSLCESGPVSRNAIDAQESFDNPARQAVVYMADRVGVAVPENATYGVLLARLLKAAGVVVERHATLHGKPAIAIVSGVTGAVSPERAGKITGTLYAQPNTYRPLEYVIHETNAILTQTFLAYQTLPAGSVTPPDLHALHPTARVIRAC